jgi:hypothetical protein
VKESLDDTQVGVHMSYYDQTNLYRVYEDLQILMMMGFLQWGIHHRTIETHDFMNRR